MHPHTTWSPIRQRALVRELRQLIDRLPEVGRHQPPDSFHQTWPPSGAITPPYVLVPPITNVPIVNVELISTTQLSLTNTNNTGEIDNMTITQEDKRPDEQVDDEEEEPTREDVQPIKKLVQEKLIKYYHENNQQLPRRIRISAHNLIPLAASELIDTVLYLHETNIIVEPDPRIGDDIQCDD